MIVPTLFRTGFFTLLVLVFSLGEDVLRGLLKGQSAADVLRQFAGKNAFEIGGHVVVMIVAFVPLFTIWEISRAIGEDRLFELFFKRKAARPPDGQ